MQRCEPLANREVIDLFDGGRMTPGRGSRTAFSGGLAGSFIFFGGSEEIEELGQIAFIISQRVGADISFVMEMIEKLREMMSEHVRTLKAR